MLADIRENKMTIPEDIPADYDGVQVVGSLSALFNAKMKAPVNCVLLPRKPEGDFDGLACKLGGIFADRIEEKGLAMITAFGVAAKLRVRLAEIKGAFTPEERLALSVIRQDMRAAFEAGYDPVLRIVGKYPHPAKGSVYDFHVDNVNRLNCCYAGPATEFVRNQDILRSRSGEPVAAMGARVFNVGTGNLWLHKKRDTDAGTRETGFLHRAPATPDGAPPRLVLISNLGPGG